MPPEICPHCGAIVPPDATACPECGSDDETGWSEEARGSNELELGIPDEEFDYEKTIPRELGGKKQSKPKIRGGWWLLWFVFVAGLIPFALAGIRRMN